MRAIAMIILAAAGMAASGESQFTGHYTLDAGASDNIQQSIDRTIAPMNVIIRAIARRRLRETNDAYDSVTLDCAGDRISIQFEHAAPVVVPATGAVIKWTDEDGETFDVSAKLVGRSIEQVFAASDGVRTNRYTLSADGASLTMNVAVQAPRLPGPLTYKLVFRRSGPTQTGGLGVTTTFASLSRLVLSTLSRMPKAMHPAPQI